LLNRIERIIYIQKNISISAVFLDFPVLSAVLCINNCRFIFSMKPLTADGALRQILAPAPRPPSTILGGILKP
jgi:hypothetical protein